MNLHQVIDCFSHNLRNCITKHFTHHVFAAKLNDSGSHLWMAVADSGPGIPAENRDEIFEFFTTSRPEAAGLGLSKARMIARNHGGNIGIEDSSDPGATFYLEVPIRD